MRFHKNRDSNSKIARILTDRGYPGAVQIFYRESDRREFVPLVNFRDRILSLESEGLIESDVAMAVKNDYPHLFFPMPTESHLEELHDQMKKLVVNGLIAAAKSGKKILLAAGEEHFSKSSLLLQALLIHIVNEAKIQYLMLEKTERRLQRMITPTTEDISLSKFNELFSSSNDAHENTEYTVKVAKKLGMCLVAADLEIPEEVDYFAEYPSAQMNQDRESYMAIKALELNDHAFFILGAAHIKGLQENIALQKEFHLVALNIMCCPRELLEYNLRNQKKLSLENRARLVHTISDQVVQITIDGNPSMQSHEKLLEIASAIHDKKTQRAYATVCDMLPETQSANSASPSGMFRASSVTTVQTRSNGCRENNNFCDFQSGFLIGKRF